MSRICFARWHYLKSFRLTRIKLLISDSQRFYRSCRRGQDRWCFSRSACLPCFHTTHKIFPVFSLVFICIFNKWFHFLFLEGCAAASFFFLSARWAQIVVELSAMEKIVLFKLLMGISWQLRRWMGTTGLSGEMVEVPR